MGFKALGLEVYAAESAAEARKTLHRLARDGETAIIYLTEQYAVQMTDEIAKYKEQVMPAVILIPGKSGSMGVGMQNIKDSVERAVGADIL